jgi:hypothetical protein
VRSCEHLYVNGHVFVLPCSRMGRSRLHHVVLENQRALFTSDQVSSGMHWCLWCLGLPLCRLSYGGQSCRSTTVSLCAFSGTLVPAQLGTGCARTWTTSTWKHWWQALDGMRAMPLWG